MCGRSKTTMNNTAKLQSHIDEIITSLHAGVFESPYWNTFLTNIRRLTQSDYVSLTFKRADAKYKDINIIKSGHSNELPLGTDDVQDIVHRSKIPYSSLELNRPYKLRDIMDFNDEKNRDYIDYLKRQNIVNTLVVRVTEPKGGMCWLTLGRSQGDFAPWITELLSRAAPHLSTAAQTLAVLEQERLRADIANEAVQRLNFGWFTFDAEARVIEMDPRTAALIHNIPDLKSCKQGQVFPLLRSEKKNCWNNTRICGKKITQTPCRSSCR